MMSMASGEPRRFLAETRAKNLLDNYGLNRPSEIVLEDIAYDLGIEVTYRPLSGAEAHLVRVGNKGGITISDRIQERGRQRFAIAHEIGHWELHQGRTQMFLCTTEDMSDYQSSAEEIEANIFASELLMPMRMMMPAHKQGDPSVAIPEEIAQRFEVSLTAAALRYVAKFNRPLMVVFSNNGQVDWWRRNDEQMEYLYLEKGQHVEIGMGRGTTAMTAVPWEKWFPHLPARPGTLREQSRKFENYNVVMSLLWLDGD